MLGGIQAADGERALAHVDVALGQLQQQRAHVDLVFAGSVGCGAAAAAIAACLGAPLEPAPFRPELRGLLLDPRGPRVLTQETGAASDAVMWSPPSKVATQHLAPYLASGGGTAADRVRAAEVDVGALLLTLAERHIDMGERSLAVRCLDAAEQLGSDLPANAVEWRRELATPLG